MDYIGRNEITSLSDRQGDTCVSLYLPTFRTGRQVEQNATRLKNLLRQAEDKLSESGLRRTAIDKILKPAHRLLEDSPFWQKQADGLAVFACEGEFTYYRLPVKFEELVVTAERFHLKPLMTMLAADGQFYLLALTKNRVQLFQGSRYGLSELDPPRMPKTLAEVLQYDMFEKQSQYHTGTPSRPGRKRSAMFFGTGDADTDEKDLLLRFFQELDKGLHSVLANEHAPLILAGVEYMLPIYRKVNGYPYLLEQHITGSPSRTTHKWLHERAWPIAEAYFRQNLQQCAQKYHALKDSDSQLASDDLETVFRAAEEGRVECLFVPVGTQLWGNIDRNSGKIALHPRQRPGDQDLLDLTATNVFSKNGQVYAVPSKEMPGESNLGAIFRY